MYEVSGNFEKLKKIVISHSASRIWDAAKTEWDIVRLTYDEDGSVCLCGHDPIKWLYTIYNRETHFVLYPIGNVCIHKFEEPALTQDADLQMKYIKLGKRLDDGELVPFQAPYFTRKAIVGLTKHNVIPASKYNSGDPERDVQFLLKMFNHRSGTYKERKKLEVLLDLYVYPFLLRFYQTHNAGRAKQAA